MMRRDCSKNPRGLRRQAFELFLVVMVGEKRPLLWKLEDGADDLAQQIAASRLQMERRVKIVGGVENRRIAREMRRAFQQDRGVDGKAIDLLGDVLKYILFQIPGANPIDVRRKIGPDKRSCEEGENGAAN